MCVCVSKRMRMSWGGGGFGRVMDCVFRATHFLINPQPHSRGGEREKGRRTREAEGRHKEKPSSKRRQKERELMKRRRSQEQSGAAAKLKTTRAIRLTTHQSLYYSPFTWICVLLFFLSGIHSC